MTEKIAEVKKVRIACQDCDCTGLHIGELEQEGSASECATCGGDGFIEAEYIPFKKKKRIKGVKKVFKSPFGCKIFPDGQEVYELQNGTRIVIDFDKYDCSYKDWFNGTKKAIVLKQLSCPLIASGQNIDVIKKMGCEENTEMENPIGCWKCYENRESCWEKLEEK